MIVYLFKIIYFKNHQAQLLKKSINDFTNYFFRVRIIIKEKWNLAF